MKRKQYFILTILLAVSASLGGLAGSLIFDPKPAHAQEAKYLDYIGAHMVRIIDQSGAVRMTLTTNGETGEPLVTMYDGEGNEKAIYGVDADEPFLTFMDKNKKGRLNVMVTKDAGGEITLFDKSEKAIWSAP